MQAAHQYALELENAFRRHFPNIPVDADCFAIHPREALETGLRYLLAEGQIHKDTFLTLLEEYTFENKTLSQFLRQCGGEEQIQELIRRISG